MRHKLIISGIAILLCLLLGIMVSSAVLAETTSENGSQTETGVVETTAETVVETTEPTTEATTAGTTGTESVQTDPEYATIIIRYVDQDNQEIDEAVVREFELGEYTFEAKSIPGYNLLSPVYQSILLSEADAVGEIIFEYQALPAITETKPTETAPTAAPTTEPVDDDDDAEPEPVTELAGIELIFEPFKIVYQVGDELDLDGLVVHAQYTDGSEQPLAIADLTVSGFDSSGAVAEQYIRIEYEGHETGFSIAITEMEKRGFWNWFLGWPLFLLSGMFLAVLIAILVIARKNRKRQGVRKPAAPAIGEKIIPPGGVRKKQVRTAAEKKKRRIRILIVVIAAIIALLLLIYAGVLSLLGQMERETISSDDEELGIDENIGDPKITNIAVFGIDSSDGMRGRSDTIMIITIDEKHDKIKITSIIRDSYVDIPGRGLDKINHAHAFGGPELAIKTINQNFKLDIRHYLSVNFSSMPQIIDAVGGVKVKITEAEAGQIRGIDQGGTHVLNGAQALQFARIRKIDSDFERSRRQRDIMESTIRAALDTPVTSYPAMLNKVFPLLTTNLSSNQMLNLGVKTVSAGISNIEQLQFPPSGLGSGQRINGIYYYVFDREAGARYLSDYIYQDIPIPKE